ncbi:MAG: lipid A 3-O-deacylase [Candidatus Omnitrophota bacterium]|jgi:lipid A 3-O-deacylase
MVSSLLIFIGPLQIYAQEQDKIPVKTKQLLREIIASDSSENERNSFLALTVENDSLGRGTDKNYTSGVRLSYLDVEREPSRFIHWVNDIVPLFFFNKNTGTTYSLGQNLYTPSDTKHVKQLSNTRPWAAFTYGSVGLSTLIEDHVDDVELAVGIVGPWALGEESQSFIHSLLGNDDPKGWSNQIDNELGFVLSSRRRWPQLFTHEFINLLFSLEPSIGGSVGNVYTLAETGLALHIAPALNRWQDTPLLARPSMPGSGFFQSQKSKIGWFAFGGLQGRLVARNIFLDGNTFHDSYHVDKKPIVVDVNAGIAFTIGNTRLSYTLVYRTNEFDSQDNNALFGAVSIGHRF